MSRPDPEYGFGPCHAEPPAHIRRDPDGHDWMDPEYIDWWISVIEGDPLRSLKDDAERTRMTELVEAQAEACGWTAPRIVDLGCGWGGLAEFLLKRYPESVFVGIDLSPAMLEHCSARLKPFGDRVELFVADLEQPLRIPPVEAGAASAGTVVLASRSLHHLRRERLAVLYRELAGQLAEGDLFLNLDRALPDLRARLVDLAVQLPLGRTLIQRWNPWWLRNASLRQQREMLAAAGFEVSITRHRPPHPKVHRPWLIQAVLGRASARPLNAEDRSTTLGEELA